MEVNLKYGEVNTEGLQLVQFTTKGFYMEMR